VGTAEVSQRTGIQRGQSIQERIGRSLPGLRGVELGEQQVARGVRRLGPLELHGGDALVGERPLPRLTPGARGPAASGPADVRGHAEIPRQLVEAIARRGVQLPQLDPGPRPREVHVRRAEHGQPAGRLELRQERLGTREGLGIAERARQPEPLRELERDLRVLERGDERARHALLHVERVGGAAGDRPQPCQRAGELQLRHERGAQILGHLRRGVGLDLIGRRRPGVRALLDEMREHADADRRGLRVEPGRAWHRDLAGVALVPGRDPGGELQTVAIVEGRRPVAQRDPRPTLDRRPVDGGAASNQREPEERVDQLATARVVGAGLGEPDAERVAEYDLERLRGGADGHELQASSGAAHFVVLAGGDEHARDARRQRVDAIELLEQAVDTGRAPQLVDRHRGDQVGRQRQRQHARGEVQQERQPERAAVDDAIAPLDPGLGEVRAEVHGDGRMKRQLAQIAPEHGQRARQRHDGGVPRRGGFGAERGAMEAGGNGRRRERPERDGPATQRHGRRDAHRHLGRPGGVDRPAPRPEAHRGRSRVAGPRLASALERQPCHSHTTCPRVLPHHAPGSASEMRCRRSSCTSTSDGQLKRTARPASSTARKAAASACPAPASRSSTRMPSTSSRSQHSACQVRSSDASAGPKCVCRRSRRAAMSRA
jgi:hypothetical protein